MLARYYASGTLDPDFGVDGIVTTNFTPYYSFVTSVLLQADGKIVAFGYVGDASSDQYALAPYLSDLNVGVLDFSLAPSEVLVYPNPVGDAATLEYELRQRETITIQLLDLQGRVQHVFVRAQEQPAGPHRQALRFPAALPAGAYVLCISNARGRVSVRIVK